MTTGGGAERERRRTTAATRCRRVHSTPVARRGDGYRVNCVQGQVEASLSGPVAAPATAPSLNGPGPGRASPEPASAR